MARATTFAGVVRLLREAEDKLIRIAHQTDPQVRASTLRGIYYGMPWSLDFTVESRRSAPGAWIRNIGFFTYTGNLAADPRPALGTALFNDLQASQSIHDHGRGADIGHALIGLETRSSDILRTRNLPGQGGTGLEIVTWLGDLGGGVASLARRRATAPRTSVRIIFNNSTSDYGVMDNLEGDAAGYLVGCGTVPGGPPVYTGRTAVADAVGAYLPISSTAQWDTRAARFAAALGGAVTRRGITNAATLTTTLADKLYDFGVWYAVTRWIPTGELLGPVADTVCKHMRGAANEVAAVFVGALANAIRSGGPIQAVGPYPAPTPAARTCDSTLMSAASTNVRSLRERLEEYGRDLSRYFE